LGHLNLLDHGDYNPAHKAEPNLQEYSDGDYNPAHKAGPNLQEY